MEVGKNIISVIQKRVSVTWIRVVAIGMDKVKGTILRKKITKKVFDEWSDKEKGEIEINFYSKFQCHKG